MGEMFCFQCQEAAGNTACTKVGVCGKTSEVANLQDVLIYVTKGIAAVNQAARPMDLNDSKTSEFIMDALFTTITNANFDSDAITQKIKDGIKVRDGIKDLLDKNNISYDDSHGSVTWDGSNIEEKSHEVGVLTTENEDVRSLRELITYGLKGLAAYYDHALNLGYEDETIVNIVEKNLVGTTKDLSVDELVAMTLKTGEYGVNAMALLDKANTSTYGNPEITEVNIGTGNNPGILISGHDLQDMEQLLEQTKGTGVDVYTHSEMLPANYYPAFKKYDHFVGNYGNSWWKQVEEFSTFNGPILFTTNCIVPPRKGNDYEEKIFTTGSAGLSGAVHIEADASGHKDFTPIIEMAKTTEPPTQIEEGSIVGGFAHNQVIALADKVVDAVKSGDIKKFFVMAGCDGRMKSREYYTDFADALPKDTVILTAGCAKYRYNKLDLGDIGGIPRILDAGQCNDSYSLAVIALKLKEVFELEDINELPIAYNIAWYEQKAVIVLLALLYLGVKDIHLGPTLPAFLSDNVANVLVDKFGIAGIGSVEEDIEYFLG
ncbi:MAG TPA: hydroxylamine reductase [Clostridia bacterium]|nr:hydroxylamine reductase [Clostridia bacterium]